ncbi:hypothetical protein EDC01DRAFT_355513 [Geopyxis carbonaria]|nr:hypothetical protein EDC01DRAFT_355513 [Geopyxis carbonaria]
MRQRTTTPRAQIRAVTSPPVPAPVPVVQTVDPSQLVVVPPPSRMPRNFEDGSQSGPSSAVFGSAANTESGINVGEGANTINVPPATETPTTAPISEITASSIPAAATTTATAGVNVTATSPTVKMKAVKGKSSTPRKRGRPRKNPLPEETPTASPSVALENKPQQSPTRQQNQVSPPAPQAYPPPQTMPNHQVLDPVSNPPPPPPQQQQSPHVVAKPATPGPRPQPTASTRHWLSDKLIMADVSTKVISRMTGVLVPVEPVRAFLETTNNFVSLCEYFEAHGARFDRSAFANTLLSMTGPPMPNPVVAEQQVQVPQVAPPVKAPPPPPPSRAPQAPALVPPSAGRMVDTISHKDQPMIDAPPSHAHKAPYMQPLYGVSPAPQTPALATRCISEDKPRFFSSLPSHSPVLAPKADANLPPNTFVIEDSPSPPAPFADFPAPQPDHSMAGPTFHTPKPHKGPAVLTKPTASSSSVPRRILTPVSKLSVTSGINRQSLNASSDKGSVIDLTGTSGADGSFDEYTQPWSRPMSPIVPLVIDGKRTEPPAKMMQRTKASRVSRYDPTNIARSILLASGKHPTERPLNAHLFPLKENIGLTWQTDLETIRWDILDPEPKNGNIDVQTNGNGTSRTQAKSNLNDPTAGGTSQVMSLMEINDHDGSIPNGHNEERRASITYHAVSDKESLKNFANARRSRKSTSKSELGGMASSPTTTTPRPNDNAHLSRDAPSSAPARNPPAGLDANLPLTASRSTHQPFHHTPSASARSDDDMLITRTAIANGPKFREYPCDWQGCKAVLHNFEALSMHVQKVHLPRSPTTCHWTPCAGVVKFDNPSEWAMHMHVVHLDPIRQSIGVGPAVLPTDAPRAGITGQVNYLVDAEGNQVTPIARPAPKGWVHTTPVGTKRSRMWAETHNTNSEPKRVRGSVNSQTHHETLDRARQFGSGMETQDFTIEAERDDGTGLDADIIR